MHIEPIRDPLMAALNPSNASSKSPEIQKHDEFVNSVAELERELIQSEGEIRPDVIHRGKELLKTENYPPLETVIKIANLLGKEIETEDSTQS
ncbi:MAG: hypothetical protein HN758_13365 [Verrucomicrobia bacterium]|jgi:hypothetical protein|nr:hypothetical protein [Verrucomicrobiota bacterium]MBT7875413.1 hypothetical protein [Verrucomicrobiota bacterium]